MNWKPLKLTGIAAGIAAILAMGGTSAADATPQYYTAEVQQSWGDLLVTSGPNSAANGAENFGGRIEDLAADSSSVYATIQVFGPGGTTPTWVQYPSDSRGNHTINTFAYVATAADLHGYTSGYFKLTLCRQSSAIRQQCATASALWASHR